QHVQYFSLAVSRWQPLRLAAPSLTSSAMPSIPSCQILSALLAGSAALVVVHALGRFAYTPLLPLFLSDGVFNLQQGAQLATWNYIGYLLGALLAVALATPARMRVALPLALLGNALLTLLQGLSE